MSGLTKYLALLAGAATIGALRAPAAPGRVSMTLSGGKTGSVEIHDAGFCVTSATLGTRTMHIFAFAANNKDWSISISSTGGMPTSGNHAVDPAHPEGVTARLIDKTVGKQASEWVRYEATEGTVTFTRSDSTHVAGSFRVTAKASWPAKDGKAVTADGTFDAAMTEGCDGAAKGRKGDVR